MTDPLTARLSELLAKATATMPMPTEQEAQQWAEAERSAWMATKSAAEREIVSVLPTLLAERAILIAERDEGRALLEPFAKAIEAHEGASFINRHAFNNQLLSHKISDFRAARAYLTKETSDG